MKKFLNNSLLPLVLLLLIFTPFKVYAVESMSSKDATFISPTCNLRMAERRLWMDHVLWTRSYIVSDLASLEDKEAVLERLLKNQDDIGDSIKPYYGEKAGEALATLLRQHISLAGQVIDAAQSGNTADLEKFNKLWYENADQIADFLSSINPQYSNKTLKEMLHTHLQLLTDQIVARLSSNWQGDIDAYDKGEDHMIMFADMLVDGIIKQFPKNFK